MVEAITFKLMKSFNERQASNAFQKAVPGLLANLDPDLFNLAITTDADGETEVSLNDWVMFEGKLLRADDERVRGAGLEAGARACCWESLARVVSQ